MLSYQHGYHAGNFADVHKHAVFALVLDYLLSKPKPLACLDLYAGRGCYDLGDLMSTKTGEAALGIRAVWDKAWPETLAVYRRVLERVGGERLRAYPGSPLLAAKMLREQDHLILNELHPIEHLVLAESVRHDSRVSLHKRDALEAMLALVPPKEKRGVVLLDPSYEMKGDYSAVPDAVGKALKHWATGVFVIWYPLLPEGRHRHLVDKLRKLSPRFIMSEVVVSSGQDAGMYGSGMFVINPPFVLPEQLATLVPFFESLGQGMKAEIRLEQGAL